jgi:hypothetical protein
MGSPSSSSARRALLVVVLVAAFVVAVSVAVVLLREGNGDSSSGESDHDSDSQLDRSPDQTVQEFIAAVDENTCEALVTYWSERWWSQSGRSQGDALAACRSSEANDDESDEGNDFPDDLDDGPFEVVEMDAENARVETPLDAPDDADNLVYVWLLVREDDEWRIDEYFTT